MSYYSNRALKTPKIITQIVKTIWNNALMPRDEKTKYSWQPTFPTSKFGTWNYSLLEKQPLGLYTQEITCAKLMEHNRCKSSFKTYFLSCSPVPKISQFIYAQVLIKLQHSYKRRKISTSHHSQ